MKKTSSEAKNLLNESIKLIEENKIEDAKKILNIILKDFNENNIDAKNNLALAEILLGNYNTAKKILLEIIETDSHNEIALGNLNYLNEKKLLGISENEEPHKKGSVERRKFIQKTEKIKSILFLGDFVPNSNFTFDAALEEYLKTQDIVLCNLEGAFTKNRLKAVKAGSTLSLNEKYFTRYSQFFDIAALANNHSMDFGTDGLLETINILKMNKVISIGSGKNINEALLPFELDNILIFNIAEHEFGGADKNKPGIATSDFEELLINLIREGKRNGKIVIIYSHMGMELIKIPPKYIRNKFRKWVENGADLIINSHPHIVQGCEQYSGKSIFYSLGNFAFNYSWDKKYGNTDWSIGVELNLEKRTTKEIFFSVKNNIISIDSNLALSNEFKSLSNRIISSNYESDFKNELKSLFNERYGIFSPADKEQAALILHYFRCEAHRNSIIEYLSDFIGENQNSLLPFTEKTLKTVYNINRDFSWAEEKMQMTKEERDYLKSILKNSKNYLELGSGFSTIWASQFAEKIDSVESRKRWFLEVTEMLKINNVDNVNLHLFEPESCAFDENGNETWTNSSRMDYGKTEEFVSYIENVKKLVRKNNYDVILVDGQVRPQIIKMLKEEKYNGIILVHDVMVERQHLNYPIFQIKELKQVYSVYTLYEFVLPPYKIEVGTGLHKPGWITTDKNIFDITKKEQWKEYFERNSIKTILGEHVLEHINPEQVKEIFNTAKEYLTDNGFFRLAVPDSNHPSRFYKHLCMENGADIGSEDHKFFYSSDNIGEFIPDGYKLKLLEWWDENGFHKEDWNNVISEGFIARSSEHYNGRITRSEDMRELLISTTPKEYTKFYEFYNITYTSLIIEIIKEKNKKSKSVYFESLDTKESQIKNLEKKIQKVYETDWLATESVFYNSITGEASKNINDLVVPEEIEIDPDGFNNFLDFGYSVFNQTPVKNIKFLENSSQIIQYSDGTFEIKKIKDLPDDWTEKITHEDDVLDLLYEKINRFVDEQRNKILIPTSGGFDSRLIDILINDKSKIKAFTYGLSDNQSLSNEVVFAKKLSQMLGFEWKQIELGGYHKYFDNWFEIFGASTHSHGMYHIEFYEKIRQIIFAPMPFISGIYGDVWAGNVETKFVRNPDELQLLGYTHGLNADINQSLLKNKENLREKFWEENKEYINHPLIQTLLTIRLKIILISYLIRVPEAYGYKVFAPYLDKDIALGMLTIHPDKRKNRNWQRLFFKKAGLLLEEMNLNCDYRNTLNLQAIKTICPKPLNADLLKDLVNPKYVHWINNRLDYHYKKTYSSLDNDSAETLKAYYAYLTLFPINKLSEKRKKKETTTHYNKKYFEYQKNIGQFGGLTNKFKFAEFISDKDVVLDFGCGGGYLLKNLCCQRRLGVEVNPEASKIAEGNGIETYRIISKVPAGTVDVVISNHALEHTSNPLEELEGLYKVLKKGGRIIFVVPHQNAKEEYQPGDVNQHLFTWNQMTLGNLFAKAGFKVKKVDAIQHMWPPEYMNIFEKYGEEKFHQICREYAIQQNNYQIRLVGEKL